MTRRRRARLARLSPRLVLAAAALGCGAPAPAPAPSSPTLSGGTEAGAGAETSGQAPSFGLGTPASSEEIARWDVDVRPDGRGLPPGGGTAAQGELVYKSKCAACHGPTGTEGPYDRLVGREPRRGFPFGRSAELVGRRTVGNYWPYATTLYDYINRAMPQNASGSLTPDEVYSLVAWLLARNDIIPQDRVMDAATLPRVVMPARDRFVPDNRRGGAEVR